jgi:hypothetical protein
MKKSVEEPGALTPTFLPTRSFTLLIVALLPGDTIRTNPGKRSKITIDCMNFCLGCRTTVWS